MPTDALIQEHSLIKLIINKRILSSDTSVTFGIIIQCLFGSHLLDETRHLLLDLLEPSLGVGGLGRVHLVDSNNELLHTQGPGEQNVLPGLSVLGDTSLELSGSRGNDEDTAVSLACASDHVLDEVTMAGGVDDGDVVLEGLKLPQSNAEGDGLQLLCDEGLTWVVAAVADAAGFEECCIKDCSRG